MSLNNGLTTFEGSEVPDDDTHATHATETPATLAATIAQDHATTNPTPAATTAQSANGGGATPTPVATNAHGTNPPAAPAAAAAVPPGMIPVPADFFTQLIAVLQAGNRVTAAAAAPAADSTGNAQLMEALILKNAKQEERENRREAPWLVRNAAVLDMLDAMMSAAKKRGPDKVKTEFLTNLLVGYRYDPTTAMVSLYLHFEPEEIGFWDMVCQTYPDLISRLKAHNLRICKKAKANPSLCPSILSMEPAIDRLQIPLLPFEAEDFLPQARSYNADAAQACIMMATEVVQEQLLRTRTGTVEGAGSDAARRSVPNAKMPKAPWRYMTPDEVVAGEPHLYMVAHPDGTSSVDAAPLAQWLVNFECNVANELRTNHNEVRQALTRIITTQESRRQPQQQHQQHHQQQRQYTAAPSASRGNGAQSNNGRGRGRGGGYGKAAYTKGGEAQGEEPVKEVAANPGNFS